MTVITGILAFILILGAAVVIHEFGHFLVAKLFKIRVETFSVGFGPRLFGKKWGHTDYRVSAIPLGGYVKLGGDESNAPLEGEGATDIPPEEMFNLRPRWQRILVALAGPVMNVITALTIPLAGALMYGVPVTPDPIVSYAPAGGAAQKAGLQSGDRIVAFNGTENPDWDTIRGDALLLPGQPVSIVVERSGQRIPLTITPSTQTDQGETFGDLDFSPDNGGYPVIIRDVAPESPAGEAGVAIGDRVLALNGQTIRSAEHITHFVREHQSQPITLTVERNKEKKEITASVRKLADETVRLGISPADELPLKRASVGAATTYAVRTNLQILRLTGKALGQFFSGKRSAGKTLSGPIGIYNVTKTSVERFGWGGFFTTLAFLSLNLGILNLLPIPVLDGGAIFLLLIEGLLAIVGLKISMRVRDRIQQVGFVMVLLLMVFVITNDILKTASNWRGGSTPPAATTPAK
jgi:regulator of sigma E protease